MATNNMDMQKFFQMLGIGGGVGSAASGLAGMFGNGNKNPAASANESLDKIPGQTEQYYSPYQKAGKGALTDLQNQYGNLLGNTGDVYNNLAGGYKESPGYQYALKSALAAGNNAAAAGGMLGTPSHQEANMNTASGIASKDFNDYLQNVLGLYGKGLAGEEGLNTQGYGANTDYGNLLANLNQQKAAYNYQGQNAQNKANQSDWGNIFSGLGMAIPSLLGLL